MYLSKRKNNASLINISQVITSDPVALKTALTELNSTTVEYGLVLTVKQINRLTTAVQKALKDSDRIEFGAGVMPILAAEFCASVFITPENYANALEALIHVFFEVKTAVCDRISDKNLIRILKDYFENSCMGSIDILRDRDIDVLIKYIEMEIDGDASELNYDVYESDGYTDERA